MLINQDTDYLDETTRLLEADGSTEKPPICAICYLIFKCLCTFTYLFFGFIVLLCGSHFVYWYIRPHDYSLQRLNNENWITVSNDGHLLFPEMHMYGGCVYFAYLSKSNHFSNENKVHIMQCCEYETIEDVKNCKFKNIQVIPFTQKISRIYFADIKDLLFLYISTESGSWYSTLNTTTEPKTLEPFRLVEGLDDSFLGRPTLHTKENKLYAFVHSNEKKEAILFESEDGVRWKSKNIKLEADLPILESSLLSIHDNLIAVAPVGGNSILGNNYAYTLIGILNETTMEWKIHKSNLTRLDYPIITNDGDDIYIFGRFQPKVDPVFNAQGSFLFSIQRTSIFRLFPNLEEKPLRHLTDLSSAGDTGCPTILQSNDSFIATYHTSNIQFDYARFLGSLLSTHIRSSKIGKKELRILSNDTNALISSFEELGTPYWDYIIHSIGFLIGCCLPICSICLFWIFEYWLCFQKLFPRYSETV